MEAPHLLLLYQVGPILYLFYPPVFRSTIRRKY
jgi:hypothetical protein